MAETNKVIFSDTRKTKTIELPSFPGSKVTIFTELNIGQQRAISNATDNFERGIAAAKEAIKEWNLYEDENTPLPITIENLAKFPQPDMILVFATVAGKTPEELMKAGEAGALAETVKKNTENGSAA